MGKGEGAEFQRKLVNNQGASGRGENDLGSSTRESGLHCQFLATKKRHLDLQSLRSSYTYKSL